MGVVRAIPVRVDGSRGKRICDLTLHDNGKIFIVDVEEEGKCKKKYSVCINKYLEDLLQSKEE